MKLDEFLKNESAPITPDDLFGEWKQRGVTSDNLSEMASKKLKRMRNKFKQFARKNKRLLAEVVECKFKRDFVPGARKGEWMALYNADGALLHLFSRSRKGFVEESVADSTAPTSSKRKRHSVSSATLTAREVQDSTPYEQRHSWTNYALLEELNAEADAKAVEWWKKHDRVPRRKRK